MARPAGYYRDENSEERGAKHLAKRAHPRTKPNFLITLVWIMVAMAFLAAVLLLYSWQRRGIDTRHMGYIAEAAGEVVHLGERYLEALAHLRQQAEKGESPPLRQQIADLAVSSDTKFGEQVGLFERQLQDVGKIADPLFVRRAREFHAALASRQGWADIGYQVNPSPESKRSSIPALDALNQLEVGLRQFCERLRSCHRDLKRRAGK